MPTLELAKLPDRVPVKLTIAVSPELNRALNDYASAYEQTYGQSESAVELIPATLRENAQAGGLTGLALLRQRVD